MGPAPRVLRGAFESNLSLRAPAETPAPALFFWRRKAPKKNGAAAMEQRMVSERMLAARGVVMSSDLGIVRRRDKRGTPEQFTSSGSLQGSRRETRNWLGKDILIAAIQDN
jgi:hypothetical protein